MNQQTMVAAPYQLAGTCRWRLTAVNSSSTILTKLLPGLIQGTDVSQHQPQDLLVSYLSVGNVKLCCSIARTYLPFLLVEDRGRGVGGYVSESNSFGVLGLKGRKQSWKYLPGLRKFLELVLSAKGRFYKTLNLIKVFYVLDIR